MAAGVDGLLRDKTRPSRIAPLKSAVIDSVVSLTLTVPPGETTHWTAAMMAAASNISASAVRRIWKVHGLQPGLRIDAIHLCCDNETVHGRGALSATIRPTEQQCFSFQRDTPQPAFGGVVG